MQSHSHWRIVGWTETRTESGNGATGDGKASIEEAWTKGGAMTVGGHHQRLLVYEGKDASILFVGCIMGPLCFRVDADLGSPMVFLKVG